jgi:hypothetical protein
MTHTELQKLAQKKYNRIMMGNGADARVIKLYNLRAILHKQNLTAADVLMLQQFVNATRQEIEQTAYVANTAVYPSSWGHTTTVLARKNTIVDK